LEQQQHRKGQRKQHIQGTRSRSIGSSNRSLGLGMGRCLGQSIGSSGSIGQGTESSSIGVRSIGSSSSYKKNKEHKETAA